MAGNVRVLRQWRRRKACAGLLHHARPHHEAGIHGFLALRLIVHIEASFVLLRSCRERELRAAQVQIASARFGHGPLFRRAPFLAGLRIHGSIVDGGFAIPAVVHVLEIAIEETQQLRRHREVADLAMLPGAHPELARIVQIVEREHGFEAAFVEPVAPDEHGDLRALDLLDVGGHAGLTPERHAQQWRDVVAIRHSAPQLCHRSAGGVSRDGLCCQCAVAILIDGQHALTEILRRIFGTGIELCGDSAAADEAVLVEIGTARSDRAQVRRERRRAVPGGAAEIRAPGDTDGAGAERLLRKPLGHVVGIVRFRAILKSAPRAERGATAASVHGRDDIAVLDQFAELIAFDRVDDFSRRIAKRAPIRRVYPHDGKFFLDSASGNGRPIDVDGETGSVPHGDVLRCLDRLGETSLRISPIHAGT